MKQSLPASRFWEASVETMYMVGIAFTISTLLALILGFGLYFWRKEGLYAKPLLYTILSMSINFIRSTPFVILMLLLIPVTRFIIGTTIGTNAVIVVLICFGVPYIARLVETSLLKIDGGVIDAAQSLGATTWQLIWHFLLPEMLSTLILNLTIAAVSLVGSTAVAGTVGGGGLGDLAIQFGYNRYDYQTMFISVFILIVFVQGIQILGTILAKHTRKL